MSATLSSVRRSMPCSANGRAGRRGLSRRRGDSERDSEAGSPSPRVRHGRPHPGRVEDSERRRGLSRGRRERSRKRRGGADPVEDELVIARARAAGRRLDAAEHALADTTANPDPTGCRCYARMLVNPRTLRRGERVALANPAPLAGLARAAGSPLISRARGGRNRVAALEVGPPTIWERPPLSCAAWSRSSAPARPSERSIPRGRAPALRCRRAHAASDRGAKSDSARRARRPRSVPGSPKPSRVFAELGRDRVVAADLNRGNAPSPSARPRTRAPRPGRARREKQPQNRPRSRSS